MAESIRRIPPEHGVPERVLHPRVSSMGRRLIACLPALLLGVMCLLVLTLRRPASFAALVLALVVLGCAAAAWRWLRPAMVAITPTHVLGSRTIGFTTMRRDRIERLVVVDALRRPAGSAQGRRRGRSRPYLWAADDAGRRLFRMDGTIWDLTSINRLVEHLGVRTERFQEASPEHLARTWPRLVGPFMRFPWLKPLLSGLALVSGVLAVLWLGWTTGQSG